MRRRVTRKQQNSNHCFVCGLANAHGLRAAFYEVEGGEVVSTFTPLAGHQSYPGRLHGGVASALLDETIGRAIMHGKPGEVWGVTIDLKLRYSKSVELGRELRGVGRVVSESSRFFEGTGALLTPEGEVAVSASGRFLKMPIHRIMEGGMGELGWAVQPRDGDPLEFELPEAVGEA